MPFPFVFENFYNIIAILNKIAENKKTLSGIL